MTAVHTQPSSLEGLKAVRIHLTTNNGNLIPDWVPERQKTAPATAEPSGPIAAKIIEERGVAMAGFLFALFHHGFRIVRTNVQAGKGDNVRLGITLERDGASIPDEHVSDLIELTREGRWDVRVDRNGPIGQIEHEHLQVSARNRTMRTRGTDRFLGVSEDGMATLF